MERVVEGPRVPGEESDGVCRDRLGGVLDDSFDMVPVVRRKLEERAVVEAGRLGI